ncbi:AMP-binding protein [Nocardioides sp. BP30]|uniref:AMP-binding protein n=1 Tax=Nocardioides sp. BP30 TaxID=3036374 RepID=UPI0024696105|nr:AMP-binding protein [Nocardioides sp. BP30]WGL54134.1 AMP-binding protein [Nocardioides sp. BP30]
MSDTHEPPYALRSWDGDLSRPEVERRVAALAGQVETLMAGDDRPVGVIARNSGQTLIAFLATVLSGSTFIPLNVHLGPSELRGMLEDGTVGLVIADASQAPIVRAAVQGMAPPPRVLSWGEEPGPDRLRIEDLPAGPDVLDPDKPVAIPLLFSSGTTGRPKRVSMPPILFPGRVSRREFLAWARTSRFVGHGPHLVAGPMYHSGPLQATWLLAAGVPIVAPRKFVAVEILETIERERIGTTLMVPTHFIRLLRARDEAERTYDVSSITHVTQTGAGCPDEVKLAMIEWWGPVFLETYGGTESGGVCFIESDEWLTHRGSVGRALPQYRILIVDANGEELPVGAEGKIYFEDSTGRGIRYENDAEKTARAHLRPGVFTLGEVGRIDAEGYLYLTDRDSDKVVSGGVNLYPAEIEQVLSQHPAVADTAVIGVDHPEMGEELRALVVLRDGAHASEDELISYVRAGLSSLKAPRSVLFVEEIPRSSMGKLNRRDLRQRFGQVEAVSLGAEAV